MTTGWRGVGADCNPRSEQEKRPLRRRRRRTRGPPRRRFPSGKSSPETRGRWFGPNSPAADIRVNGEFDIFGEINIRGCFVLIKKMNLSMRDLLAAPQVKMYGPRFIASVRCQVKRSSILSE